MLGRAWDGYATGPGALVSYSPRVLCHYHSRTQQSDSSVCTKKCSTTSQDPTPHSTLTCV